METETHISAAEFWIRARVVDRDAFLSKNAHPFLLGLFLPQESSRSRFATLSGDTRRETGEPAGRVPRPVPQSEVIPLKKRAGVSFADKITVGRTQNNDVVIRDLLVSKLHGFFTVSDDGTASFTDSGSSNGTTVDGVTAPPFEQVPLRNGSTILFGTRAAYLFLTADELYTRLQDSLGTGS